MAWSKKKEDKDLAPHRAKELALRESFKDVKSVTPQGKIEKGSVTVSHGGINGN